MLQKLIIICAFICILPAVFASDRIGFSSGDTFSAYDYEGSMTLFCPGESRRVICRGHGLEPGEFDHLVFPSTIDADKVTLTRTNTRGDTRTKSSDIRNGQSRSKKSFNLWIRTLFQRPLLSMGDNTIRYSFEKNGNVIEEGTFHTQVIDGGIKSCRHLTLTGGQGECQNPSLKCNEYFRRTSCQ